MPTLPYWASQTSNPVLRTFAQAIIALQDRVQALEEQQLPPSPCYNTDHEGPEAPPRSS